MGILETLCVFCIFLHAKMADDSFDFEALMSKVDALEQSVLPSAGPPSPERRTAVENTPESRADAAVERLEASLARYSGGKATAQKEAGGYEGTAVEHHDWETLPSPSSSPGSRSTRKIAKKTKKVKKTKETKKAATAAATAKRTEKSVGASSVPKSKPVGGIGPETTKDDGGRSTKRRQKKPATRASRTSAMYDRAVRARKKREAWREEQLRERKVEEDQKLQALEEQADRELRLARRTNKRLLHLPPSPRRTHSGGGDSGSSSSAKRMHMRKNNKIVKGQEAEQYHKNLKWLRRRDAKYDRLREECRQAEEVVDFDRFHKNTTFKPSQFFARNDAWVRRRDNKSQTAREAQRKRKEDMHKMSKPRRSEKDEKMHEELAERSRLRTKERARAVQRARLAEEARKEEERAKKARDTVRAKALAHARRIKEAHQFRLDKCSPVAKSGTELLLDMVAGKASASAVGTSQKDQGKERFGVTVTGAGYSTPPGVGKLCVDALGRGLGSAYAMAAVDSVESGSSRSSSGNKTSGSCHARAGDHELSLPTKQDTGGHDIVNLLQSVEDMFEKTCSAWAVCRVESERLQEAIDRRLAASTPKDREENAHDEAAGLVLSERLSTLRSRHLERLTGGSHPGSGSPSSVVSDTGSVRVVDEQILV